MKEKLLRDEMAFLFAKVSNYLFKTYATTDVYNRSIENLELYMFSVCASAELCAKKLLCKVLWYRIIKKEKSPRSVFIKMLINW